MHPALTTVLVAAAIALSLAAGSARAVPPPCNAGTVFEDRNGNGALDGGERGVPGVQVSDGVAIVRTDARGQYILPVVDGRTTFVIKPAGYRASRRADGLPDVWRNVRTAAGPALRFGGIPAESPGCRNFGLVRDASASARSRPLEVVLFADPQTKSMRDVDYYRRDIIDTVRRERATPGAPDRGHPPAGAADLGLSLGDITDDDLALYPALIEATASLGVPWLHAAGNHDLDFDAARDEDSLLTFRRHFGPDTFAWEEPEATFVVLDDVVYRPGASPAYVGGLRDDQFAFLESYLPTVPTDRLLVVAVHIPFFDAAPGRETFRRADRERLFALLQRFPKVLLLSGHSHTQRHVFHDAASGWRGAAPLHEYNVGAACGAFWSGIKDAVGIPDATMADGTPNGYARLRVARGGDYRLSWHPAGEPGTAMALHAPKVLRRGAYPAWGVYANVFMGRDDTRVEFRIDDGPWQPMRRVDRPDPRMQIENARDDQADALRGFDRSPEATPSAHLWRGALPTDRAAGTHRIEVRAFDAWVGEQRATTTYRLDEIGE
ncbi:calcineurin-like phosphoesterase C-terminal domain-containing protein [Cognatilysobacter tabacisoli]|uniref:calcineurin-like phosphoesterase C-terminal domain-containing protein n=1 Tax=Cognatilysobacter tabacisoli TaxID=2315424 RepID=UPI000E6B069F|nr:calcineurin-like phosphoesterase family protein [Lysobacter tabacisoli]